MEHHGCACFFVLPGICRTWVYPSTSSPKAPSPFHDGVRNLEARRSGAGRGVLVVCVVLGPVVHQMLFACVGLCFLQLIYVLSCLALLAEAFNSRG